MITHYHNTIPNNPDNQILGYVSNFGDWSDSLDDFDGEDDMEAAIEVIYDGGLICCEPLDQYLRKLASTLSKKYGIN